MILNFYSCSLTESPPKNDIVSQNTETRAGDPQIVNSDGFCNPVPVVCRGSEGFNWDPTCHIACERL